MSETGPLRILVTGATGFVGRNLVPALLADGHQVLCASRHPPRTRARADARRWVQCDVDDPGSVEHALHGCDAVYYLVHAMHEGGDYASREKRAASHLARIAQQGQLRRIVYLGGVAPAGHTSRHLRSRLAVGEILRAGSVPCVELRASMIIGAGSESFRMVRDLCVRLPALALPGWLRHRSQPIALVDVVAALRRALQFPEAQCGVQDIPGPEVLSGVEILCRTRRLLGLPEHGVVLPGVSPLFAASGMRWLTRADGALVRELLQGMQSDLLAASDGLWLQWPEHRRQDFDTAARLALDGEARSLGLGSRAFEAALGALWTRVRRGRG